METFDLLEQLPRRFTIEGFVKLCFFFETDVDALTQLYCSLPVNAKAHLHCRVTHRAGSAMEFSEEKLALLKEGDQIEDWAKRYCEGFRRAEKIRIGEMSREGILSVYNALFPDCAKQSIRNSPMTIYSEGLGLKSEYYRKNFYEIGILSRLGVAEVPLLSTLCPKIRWEYARVESFPECIRSELPDRPGKIWISSRLPEGEAVSGLLDEWIATYNSGPTGPAGGWAAQLFAEFCQIHPLPDGNGRVGALIYNSLLKQLEFPLPSLTVPDVSVPLPPRSLAQRNEIVVRSFKYSAREILKRTLWHHTFGGLRQEKHHGLSFWQAWSALE